MVPWKGTRMAWFNKGPERPPAPEAWTADLWEAAFPGPDRFHCLILVQEIRKQRKLSYGSRSLDATTRYRGIISGPPGSPAEHIRASIDVDTADVPLNSERAPAHAQGIAFTSNFKAVEKAW